MGKYAFLKQECGNDTSRLLHCRLESSNFAFLFFWCWYMESPENRMTTGKVPFSMYTLHQWPRQEIQTLASDTPSFQVTVKHVDVPFKHFCFKKENTLQLLNIFIVLRNSNFISCSHHHMFPRGSLQGFDANLNWLQCTTTPAKVSHCRPL